MAWRWLHHGILFVTAGLWLAGCSKCATTDCLDDPDLCIQSSACAQRDIWSELEQVVQTILDKTTIATLAERTPMAEMPSAAEAKKPQATPVEFLV